LKFSAPTAAAKQQGNAQGIIKSGHHLKVNKPEPFSGLPLTTVAISLKKRQHSRARMNTSKRQHTVFNPLYCLL